MEETPHITAIRKQWQLNTLSAKRRIRIINGKTETYAGTPPAQDLQKTLADARAAQDLKHEAERIYVGKMIPGQGIYLGTWKPKDKDGKSLGKIFNVYAAPQDLTDAETGKKGIFRYVDAVQRVADLKNWHGHNGAAKYATDKEFLTALKNGSYKGGWVVPPFELLYGRDEQGNKVMSDSLLTSKEKGALKGTFMTKSSANSYVYPEWYWSSTDRRPDSGSMKTVDFSNGMHSNHYKNVLHLSCRPVRLVPAV